MVLLALATIPLPSAAFALSPPEVTVSAEGAVNHQGVAFVSARIRCAGADYVGGRARLTQLAGATRVRAVVSVPTGVTCSDRWQVVTLAFRPAGGRFSPGRATYGMTLTTCSELGCVTAPPVSATVRLWRTG